MDGNYPEINGKLPTPESFYFDIYKDGKQEYDGSYEYKDLGMPIDFTGKIVLGDGFLQKYYIHMGFQRAWAYERLIELDIEEGISQIEELSFPNLNNRQ